MKCAIAEQSVQHAVDKRRHEPENALRASNNVVSLYQTKLSPSVDSYWHGDHTKALQIFQQYLQQHWQQKLLKDQDGLFDGAFAALSLHS